ncbi:MAG: FAD:protein FMN transferase [Ruminococcaceae bacterium]|nr:FAD:protein FMN transferase [Oscillospiraceae bacterium]
MKKISLFLSLLALLFLTSCGETRFSTHYFNYFDTVISVDGYFENAEDFNNACKIIEDTLGYYDGVFDIYDDGELKKLNEEKSLTVSPALYDAILFSKEVERLTNGYCNVALGSVLSLWHNARESEIPYLPSYDDLYEKSLHTDIEKVSLEENFGVVFLDENISLDMGAIAKGYVSDVLRERLQESGFTNLLINLGGNVVVLGDKDGDGWLVGVQSPEDEDGLAHTISVKDSCLVTSGSYQRFFEYDGVKYHHIISPDTLYPATLYSSVSVLYENGALADALSTALFCMSVEEGKEILENFDNIGVMWVTQDGEKIYYGSFK